MQINLGIGRFIGPLVLLGLSTACGGDDADPDSGPGGPGGSGGGTVTDTWRSYCTATFNADTPISDPFGDVAFTARAGEEYLIGSYENFASPRVSLVYLAATGPYTVDLDATGGAFPFTPSCELEKAVPYYAVFNDVSVYAEEALTTKLCDLKAGTVLPRTNGNSGYGIAGDLSFSGPATYELFLNAFSPMCGNALSGYISVPAIHLFGTTTWLIQVDSVIGPP
jgi:hypothetical protein